MSLIQIDDSKCKKDGICVKECPASIISHTDKKMRPEMVAGAEPICLLCGHCVAVCPHGALDHKKIPLEECPSVTDDLLINQDQALQFLRSRRSIRNFKKKAVEKEIIESLINNARYAPTGSNSQTVQWTVHTDENTIKEIADLTIDWMRSVIKSGELGGMASYLPLVVAAYEAGTDTIARGAPCLIFASAPKANPGGLVDVSIALSYLELIAVPAGLGTCWAGLIKRALHYSEPLQQKIGLPESHTHVYPMMVGYPKFAYHRLPERKSAKISWN